VRAEDVNEYLKQLAGDEFTAKDLRTWHATVLSAGQEWMSTRPALREVASGRGSSLSVRWPSTWATHPRSLGSPTSTRG